MVLVVIVVLRDIASHAGPTATRRHASSGNLDRSVRGLRLARDLGPILTRSRDVGRFPAVYTDELFDLPCRSATILGKIYITDLLDVGAERRFVLLSGSQEPGRT